MHMTLNITKNQNGSPGDTKGNDTINIVPLKADEVRIRQGFLL